MLTVVARCTVFSLSLFYLSFSLCLSLSRFLSLSLSHIDGQMKVKIVKKARLELDYKTIDPGLAKYCSP